MSIILTTDSYKVSHWKQYPPDTSGVFSYLESRGGPFHRTLFFGLQYILAKHLRKPIRAEDISEAEEFCGEHFGRKDLFNRPGWEKILTKHHGYLPLLIRAVPEGMRVPTRNALITVENTDPEFFWLTNYVETILSQVWYPTTVATLSAECRETIQRFLDKTGDEGVSFKLHDFGFRGSTSEESSAIGGLAHLVNFMGSDTLSAIKLARDYYGSHMAGYSIPAAEHSTITSWGREFEKDAYENMLHSYPNGLVAVVSDSYDIYKACDHIWGEILHDQVLKRDGIVVIRPDSGYPPDVVHKCLDILGARFGFSTNSKGYRVLNPKIRIIQGDGVDPEMIANVLVRMETNKWSADNIAFGMGGALLQKVNRDTCRFAFKCSSIAIDGHWQDVFKEPATDLGKRSKPGRLALIKLGSEWATVREEKTTLSMPNILQTVYENGVFFNNSSLNEVRKRARE